MRSLVTWMILAIFAPALAQANLAKMTDRDFAQAVSGDYRLIKNEPASAPCPEELTVTHTEYSGVETPALSIRSTVEDPIEYEIGSFRLLTHGLNKAPETVGNPHWDVRIQERAVRRKTRVRTQTRTCRNSILLPEICGFWKRIRPELSFSNDGREMTLSYPAEAWVGSIDQGYPLPDACTYERI